MRTLLTQNKPWRFSFTSALLVAVMATLSGQGAEAKKPIRQPTTTTTTTSTSTTTTQPVASTPPAIIGVAKVSSSVSLSSVSAGQVQSLKASVKSSTNLSGLIVDIRIYNSANAMVVRKNFDNASLAAGVATAFQFDYTVPSTLPTGSYTAVIAVFSSSWSTYLWDDIGAFSVVAASSAPAPAPSSSLTNSGFESGMTSWDNWGNAVTVGGQAHSGSSSLQVGAAAGGAGRDIMSLLSVGGSYELAAYARSTNPAEYAEISMTFKNSSNVVLLSKTIKVESSSYALYKLAFTVPSGSVTAHIGIWKNAGSSYLHLDDFSLVAMSSSTPTTSPTTTTTMPAPSTGGGYSGEGYPFGSRKTPYVAGIRPTNASQADQDQAVINLYNKWKTTLVAGCGGYYVKFRDPYAAVSEGIGYGMLITVVMAGYDPNAKTYFDGLVRFVRSHPAYNVDPALLDWRVNGDCSPGDGWAAPDGDLDIAMALLMADRQWGSTGAINYKAEGIRTANALKNRTMSPLGYTMGGPAPDLSRTSDYMIGHFRAFKKATGDPYWDLAINKSFELMSLMQSQFAPNTGLIPDFIVGLPNNPGPSPGGRIESMTEGFFAWNACRIPWRLGTDYVTSGDPRSRDVAGKFMDFMNRTTGGNPILIPMGWKLDGTPLTTPDPWYSSPSFSGPAVAGAMIDGRFQSFLNSLWTLNATKPAAGYYDYELQLLSMMVASGNWWNP